jgi:small subunit ribosomal protein S8
MNTDPIADMLTRIRNGIRARQQKVDVPFSRFKMELARILKEEGYIGNYKTVEEAKNRKMLRLMLKYSAGKQSVISGIRRVSRPGCRAFAGKSDLRPVFGGLGISIVTTPKGLMTGKNARKTGVGGEILCEVW